MLLRRLENIMRASGGGSGDGGGVRGRQPLITTAHTLPPPILIIIMTELQLACRAAGTLLLMRLCFWMAGIVRCRVEKNSSAKPFVTLAVDSEIVSREWEETGLCFVKLVIWWFTVAYQTIE